MDTGCQSVFQGAPGVQPGEPLALAGREPFGVGGRRLCFVHPADPSKCVKVLRRDERRTVRVKGKRRLVPAGLRRAYDNNLHEQSVLAGLERRLGPAAFAHFPRCYGRIPTDLGPGLVLDLIRDDDGRISRSIRELITVGYELDRLCEAFDTFGRFLSRHRILTRHLLDHNLVVRMRADGAQTVYMIDGLGDPAWLSPARWVPALARAKVARRLRDAWRRFAAFAATGGVTDEMRRTSAWGQGILNFRE